MGREITEKERALVDKMVSKAKSAMVKIENWTQRDLDRLSQAIAWYAGNEKTFTRLAQQGVDESGIGDRAGRPGKRFKIHMVLRDVLRTPSTGIVETDAKRGLVKYAKPAGVIASLIPMTNPAMTPPVTGVSSANARNAVIFSPHPRTAATTCEMSRIMRAACHAVGAPEDLFQCIERPSIPMTQYLMESCDLTLATGGKPMVQAAYSSGKPAYGVGAGNSTIVVDETADLNEAAKNIMISKTSDFGSGCSADGNIVIQKSIYSNMVSELQANNGYLCNSAEKELLSRAMWDNKENRTFSTIACKPQQLA
ncbi:MAG: aldehyde dehydrogenase family protein, partial [Paracoccaceae bacterium]